MTIKLVFNGIHFSTNDVSHHNIPVDCVAMIVVKMVFVQKKAYVYDKILFIIRGCVIEMIASSVVDVGGHFIVLILFLLIIVFFPLPQVLRIIFQKHFIQSLQQNNINNGNLHWLSEQSHFYYYSTCIFIQLKKFLLSFQHVIWRFDTVDCFVTVNIAYIIGKTSKNLFVNISIFKYKYILQC